ncbi:Serine/threonine-protein phosphatase BSL1 [Trichinella pseudospiralis]
MKNGGHWRKNCPRHALRSVDLNARLHTTLNAERRILRGHMEGTGLARYISARNLAVNKRTIGRGFRFDYSTRYVHYCRYQSAELPMKDYPFGSKDHRRVQLTTAAIVLVKGLARTSKNDPLVYQVESQGA